MLVYIHWFIATLILLLLYCLGITTVMKIALIAYPLRIVRIFHDLGAVVANGIKVCKNTCGVVLKDAFVLAELVDCLVLLVDEGVVVH